MEMEVLDQELMVTEILFKKTLLLPWLEAKPLPVIVTRVPAGPVVVESPLIEGAGSAAELMETLSNVVVESVVVFLLLAPRPM